MANISVCDASGGIRQLAENPMVRDTRVELVLLAWEANVLPLYESRWSHLPGLNRRPTLYEPSPFGADRRNRTADLHFTKVLLYQLSYIGIINGLGYQPPAPY